MLYKPLIKQMFMLKLMFITLLFKFKHLDGLSEVTTAVFKPLQWLHQWLLKYLIVSSEKSFS